MLDRDYGGSRKSLKTNYTVHSHVRNTTKNKNQSYLQLPKTYSVLFFSHPVPSYLLCNSLSRRSSKPQISYPSRFKKEHYMILYDIRFIMKRLELKLLPTNQQALSERMVLCCIQRAMFLINSIYNCQHYSKRIFIKVRQCTACIDTGQDCNSDFKVF